MKLFQLTENTVLSFNVVVVVLSLTIWVVRLSDRVEAHDKYIAAVPERKKEADEIHKDLDRRLYRVEVKLHLPHSEN